MENKYIKRFNESTQDDNTYGINGKNYETIYVLRHNSGSLAFAVKNLTEEERIAYRKDGMYIDECKLFNL